MKILVTVGTTKFDSLIRYIDINNCFIKYDIQFQIANGIYIPENHNYLRFCENIYDLYNESDIIITHGGAGTIYSLLEMKKKIIIVPNMDRIDKHQLDIANFIKKSNYAFIAYNFNQLSVFTELITDYRFNEYQKQNFQKACEILNYIVN